MGIADEFKFLVDMYEAMDEKWQEVQESLGIDRQYSHEGFGFTNASKMALDLTPEEYKPYIPGMDVVQLIDDSQRYWNDYTKNTGKTRRYPGLQTHTPNLSDAVSVAKTLDWWL